MKITIFYSLFFFVTITTMLAISSCEEDEENKSPNCSIISPKESAIITLGEVITISVEADDPDGNLKEVRFFIDNVGVGIASNFPYKYDWNTSDILLGDHKIKVEVIDEEQAKSEDEVDIIIFNKIASEIVMDYDGNEYKTVQIGDQLWMAENLKTTHYAVGTEITLVENNAYWGWLTASDKAYCFYDNNIANKDIYGALYTWAAAMNGATSSDFNPSGIQGICPTGWHLPSDDEWKELELYLGMNQAELDEDGFYNRGTGIGSKLKTKSGWNNDGNGNNMSAFSALPAGARWDYSTTFFNLGVQASFWSSTEDYYYDAYIRQLSSSYTHIERHTRDKENGYSVRCIKD
ncbi:MAG: FISUMP domain-containing protein [Bacteroidales bacterium]|jgi:uncharacterized protein (TIGR02145 family)|nr:FISUMP domain-containing protein [Bacteroidales bacterium]